MKLRDLVTHLTEIVLSPPSIKILIIRGTDGVYTSMQLRIIEVYMCIINQIVWLVALQFFLAGAGLVQWICMHFTCVQCVVEFFNCVT